jgi:hypothetical protein
VSKLRCNFSASVYPSKVVSSEALWPQIVLGDGDLASLVPTFLLALPCPHATPNPHTLVIIQAAVSVRKPSPSDEEAAEEHSLMAQMTQQPASVSENFEPSKGCVTQKGHLWVEF